MTQHEYLKELKHCLSPLSNSEKTKVVEYYGEFISDKIENGQTEEEVLSEFGSPDELAEKILSESPEYKKNEKHKAQKTGKLSAGRIVGFSVLLPFVIIAVATLYTIAASFACASVSMMLAGVLRIVGTFALFFKDFAVGLFSLGMVLFVVSLGLFAGFGTIQFIKLCNKITVNIFKAYKKTYVREAVSI